MHGCFHCMYLGCALVVVRVEQFASNAVQNKSFEVDAPVNKLREPSGALNVGLLMAIQSAPKAAEYIFDPPVLLVYDQTKVNIFCYWKLIGCTSPALYGALFSIYYAALRWGN